MERPWEMLHILVITSSSHDSLPEPVRIASSPTDHFKSRADCSDRVSATVTTHSGAELTAYVFFANSGSG